MDTPAIIRAASAQDSARLALIGAASFLETFAGQIEGEAMLAHCRSQHSEDFYAGQLAAGGRAWLAEIDGAPVGYALLCDSTLELTQDGDCELKRIYVLSRFHGSGLAARLMAAALAGTEGYRRLLLGTKADNFRAIAFYRKQGFTEIGTRQFDVGGRVYDDAVMARPLSASAFAHD